MAQADVQNILEGLRQAQTRRAERTRTQLEQQQLQQQKENQEATIKLHHEQLDEQKKQADLANKASQAVFQLKHEQAKQDVIDKIYRGESPSIGAPAAAGTGGAGYSPIDSAKATSEIHTLPPEYNTDGQPTTVQMPTQAARAQEAAKLYEITNKPKEEALTREQLALQESRNTQSEANKKSDLDRLNTQKQYDDARALEDRKSREMIAAAGNASRERVAKLSKGLSAEWQNYDVQPHVMDALSGDISREDLSRMTLPPQLKMAVIDGVKSAGGNLLSKDQQKVAADYSGLVNIVKTMDDLLAKIPQNTGKGVLASGLASIKGAAAGLDKDVTGLEKQLEGAATIIGRTVSKDNRVSDQDAKRVGLGFFPSKSDLLENNIKKRNNYVNQVNTAIDAKLSTIPAAQRNLIKKKLGLDSIPLLPMPGQGQPAAPQGAAPALSPAAQELLKRHGIQ